MAINVKTLSPAKLKELRTGDKITIRFARSQDEVEAGASRIICEQFPKRIATAFSTKWAAAFPSVNKMSLAQMSQPSETAVTIVGGSAEIIRMVLDWMLSCCDGKGIQEWCTYAEKPFSKYFILKETADHLQIPILSEEMGRRMKAIAGKQIHSEDVRAMYLRLPPNHPILKDIAAHIAELIFNNELKAFGAYRTLREEISQFDQDVNEVLEPKVLDRREERLKVKEAREADREPKFKNKQLAKKGQKTLDAGRGKNVSMNIDPDTLQMYTYTNRGGNNRQPSSSQASNTAPNTAKEIANDLTTHHKTLRCSVARKAQGGRPAYVSLSLADAGIDKDEFTGDAFLPPAPKHSRRELSSPSKMNSEKVEASNFCNGGNSEGAGHRGLGGKESTGKQSEAEWNLVATNGKKKHYNDKDHRCIAAADTPGYGQRLSTKAGTRAADSTRSSFSPSTSSVVTTPTLLSPTPRTHPSTTASSVAGSVSDSRCNQPTSALSPWTLVSPKNLPLATSSTPKPQSGMNADADTNTTFASNLEPSSIENTTTYTKRNAAITAHTHTDLLLREKSMSKVNTN